MGAIDLSELENPARACRDVFDDERHERRVEKLRSGAGLTGVKNSHLRYKEAQNPQKE
jgi:hypothetical protein